MTNTGYMHISEGQRVRGCYCGGHFTGTVTNLRDHTINGGARILFVNVDGGKITMTGDIERDRPIISLTIGPDGREVGDALWCADYVEVLL